MEKETIDTPRTAKVMAYCISPTLGPSVKAKRERSTRGSQNKTCEVTS